MTKIERVRSVLSGSEPDRPPVSFWCHFAPGSEQGSAAVEAHLRHLERFDVDFLKVMNDNGYPSKLEVRKAQDLRELPVLRGEEDAFGRQLELVRTLVDELRGKVLLITTIFNAWSVLRRIVTPRSSRKHNPPVLGRVDNPVDIRLSELLAEDRTSVAMALDAIAASLSNFTRKCIEAGADGIFLSVRDDWVNTEANGRDTYDEMVRVGDGQILNAAGGAAFNMLHVCGVSSEFDAFSDYPVHVVNWADRAAGPSIADVAGKIKPVICGGVDNLATLPRGTPSDVHREVADAIRQAGEHPFIVAPGCTYDPAVVPEGNLLAIVDTVKKTAPEE